MSRQLCFFEPALSITPRGYGVWSANGDNDPCFADARTVAATAVHRYLMLYSSGMLPLEPSHDAPQRSRELPLASLVSLGADGPPRWIASCLLVSLVELPSIFEADWESRPTPLRCFVQRPILMDRVAGPYDHGQFQISAPSQLCFTQEVLRRICKSRLATGAQLGM